ncbi:hypothetical protein CDAR_194851 [Caerostris darwini]|uniref:Uncharacterized protein n=1 Tax=Caerostris darwini TaxID=1538125 RepID=A0AAV4X5A5_9ARAC|nr:hypothetical protein CDAR_194851 [Caerostris darwini]
MTCPSKLKDQISYFFINRIRFTPLSLAFCHLLKSHGPPRGEKTVKYGEAPYFKTLTQRITSYVRLYNILTASLVFWCNNCSPRIFSGGLNVTAFGYQLGEVGPFAFCSGTASHLPYPLHSFMK